MKKPIYTLITTALVITMLLAACSGGTDNSTPTPPPPTPPPVDDPIKDDYDVGGSGGGAVDTGTGLERPDYWPDDPSELDMINLTMFVAERGQAPSKNNPIIAMVEDFTRVHIEFEFLVGDLEQRMGTMIAAENYPDLINPGNGRPTYQEEGAFIPLEDLYRSYDNLRNHYEPYDKKLRAASPDGRIYLLDIWNRWYGEPIETFYNGPAFWVQKAVLAENGYVIPQTLDEFFDMLEMYKNKYPEIDGQPTLTFEILSTIHPAFPLLNAPQHLIGGPNDGDVFVHQDTLTAEMYADKDYAKTYFQKLNDAYKRGMINPETFTRNKDQYMANIASGRVLAMFDQAWNFEDGEKVLMADDNWERTYLPLGLVYDGYEAWYKEIKSFQGGNGIGISIKCGEVERALLYLDMLLDEELQKLMAWGQEDKEYYMDNGRARRTYDQKLNYENKDYHTENTGKWLYDQMPKMQGYFSDGNCVSIGDQIEEMMANISDYDKDFFSNFKTAAGNPFLTVADFLTVPKDADGLPKGMPAYFPVWAFSVKKTSDAGVGRDNYYDVAKNSLPRCIMADDFESEWGKYVTALEKTNMEAFAVEATRQIQERMANQ